MSAYRIHLLSCSVLFSFYHEYRIFIKISPERSTPRTTLPSGSYGKRWVCNCLNTIINGIRKDRAITTPCFNPFVHVSSGFLFSYRMGVTSANGIQRKECSSSFCCEYVSYAKLLNNYRGPFVCVYRLCLF